MVWMLVWVSGVEAESGLSWPIKAKPGMTSSFGELRPGHLHAGVDLKTWGKIGLPVWAVGDGYVWRVRTSPWGYGKAVYLKLEDGRCAVYAHLRGFAPPIASRVRAAQERTGRYTVDLYFEKGEIPVTRGENIGWSGQSAAKWPHLHFELRDVSHRPINPLTHGLKVRDTIPPTLKAVSLRPLDLRSSVDGGQDPLIVEIAEGRCKTDHPPQIWGRVAVGVAVDDHADGTDNPLSVYGVRLLVDGKEEFAVQYDRFSYDETRHVDVDRDFGLMQAGKGEFHHLFVAPGNPLHLYASYGPGDGILRTRTPGGLSPGLHQVRIVAMDAAGNRSTATLAVLVDQPPWIGEMRIEENPEGRAIWTRAWDEEEQPIELTLEQSDDRGRRWRIVDRSWVENGAWRVFKTGEPSSVWRAIAVDGWGVCSFPRTLAWGRRWSGEPGLSCTSIFRRKGVEVSIQSRELLAALPKVRATVHGKKIKGIRVDQLDLRHYRALVDLPMDREEETIIHVEALGADGGREEAELRFTYGAVRRGKRTGIAHPSGIAEISFPPDGVYEDLCVQIEPARLETSGELKPVGEGIRVDPNNVPLDRGATVSLRLPEDVHRTAPIGVYQYDGEEWVFVGNQVDRRTHRMSAEVHYFSTFGLFSDETPPSIWDLWPTPGARIHNRTPRLLAHVKDEGGGIDREERIVMMLDGRKVIAEYDPPRDRVFYEVRHALAPGSHRLTVRAQDRFGNEGRAESVFVVE